jgi:hypothetical protein
VELELELEGVDVMGAVAVDFAGAEDVPSAHWQAVEEVEDQHLRDQYLPHQHCLLRESRALLELWRSTEMPSSRLENSVAVKAV